MNMKQKTYVFVCDDTGEEIAIIASSLAEATNKLCDNFTWDRYLLVSVEKTK